MKKTSMLKHKIVLLTLDYPPERGGVARYLGNLVMHAHRRIRVIVEAGHDTDGPGSVETRELFRRAWPRWWPMVGVCRSLDRASEQVLASHVFPVGTAAMVSRMFGGPEYSVLLHGLDVRLARTAWKRWLFRRVCRSAHAVIANSESTKSDAIRLAGGADIRVITPGVEHSELPSKMEARTYLGIGPDEQIVLSIARLVPRKGIDVALRAMGRIQHRRNVRYVVVGDGPDLRRLEQVATTARARVEWLRSASDDEKWLWLAAADVFLLPVRDEGIDVEGFGIVFLEAALAGVPSVAGNSGGASEAVRHERTGLLVKPRSDDDVEQAVLRLLKDPDERAKLGDEVRGRVLKDFRWEDKTAAFLAELD